MKFLSRIKIALNTFLIQRVGYKFVRADKDDQGSRGLLQLFLESNSDLMKGNVLEVGTGTWRYTEERFGDQCTLTTFDQAAYDYIDIVGDLMQLSSYVSPESFDTIVCLEVLEHVKEPYLAIREMLKALKPGGSLIAATPFLYEVHGEEYGDYWRFTRQGWEHLLRDFTDVRIDAHFNDKRPKHYLVVAKK